MVTLYCKDKSGKLRSWTICREGNTVTKSYGLVGGKMVTSTRTFKGVNKGKSNETTAEEQARLEMERDIKKQKEKGYSAKDEKVSTEKISTESKSIDIIPMKASTWDLDPKGGILKKVSKHFNFSEGVFIQPKYDGVRCSAYLENGEVVLSSNTAKRFLWLNSLREQLKKILSENLILDGELYSHSITTRNGEVSDSERFGIITGACRCVRNEPSDYEDQISFHIFDIIDESEEQYKRLERLKEIFKRVKGDKLVLAETIHVKGNEEEIVSKVSELHDNFALQGFEGVIVRSYKNPYKRKHRSLEMRKFKHFFDEEYEIIGVELDEGVPSEQFVWVCATGEKKFKAKPVGTKESKLYWYSNREDYIGQYLTVKYQELSPDGVPRFPIGKGIRSLEDHGKTT